MQSSKHAAAPPRLAVYPRCLPEGVLTDTVHSLIPEPKVTLSRIKQQMHREVGHCNMLQIVRNIRDNMEFLELPGGGSHQPSTGVRRTGGARAVEFEDDFISFRDPGHRAGPGGFD